MSSFAVDGMISGLDTTSLVQQLVAAESQPRNLLQRRADNTQQFIGALQNLNTKVASLAESAQSASKAESWQAVQATSSSESVAATVGTGAQVGSVSFEVKQLATAQVSIFDPASLAQDGTLTINRGDTAGGDPEPITITPSSGNPADIVAAINRTEDLGVQATLVRVGVGEDGETPQYMVQLTGTTGEDNAFDVYAGSGIDGNPLADRDGAVTAASNAEIALWSGTEAELTLTSTTNTFSDLMTGVDVTVSRVDTEPVTITLDRDAEAQQELITDMIGAMGAVLSDISGRTATQEATDDAGNPVVRGGMFAGDSAIRSLRTGLQDAFTRPVEGQSPATVLGISISRTGEIELDEDVLAASLADDPQATMAFAQQLAERVHGAADMASDRYDGTLTQKITSQESLHRSLERQVSDWDVRIERRESTLLAQFTAMEVALSNLQGQSNWLASQLAGLPGAQQ